MSKVNTTSHRNSNVLLNELVHCFEIVQICCSWIYVRFSKKSSSGHVCLVGKTAVVTGGSSGLGIATAILLASRGCRVIIANRRVSEKHKNIIIQKTNNPNIIAKPLDLSSFKSVRNFAKDIKATESKIDILINNAGIAYSKEKYSVDGLNPVMHTNVFGPFLLTHLLLDSLKAAGCARIIFTSSGLAVLHQLDLDTLKRTYHKSTDKKLVFYKNSKVCNVLAAQEFAKRVEKYGLNVYSVDPGISRTPIFDGLHGNSYTHWTVKWFLEFSLSVFGSGEFEGAENNLHVSTSDQVESGQHYFQCRRLVKPWICGNQAIVDHYFQCRRLVKPWICGNQAIVDQIWRQCEEIVQLEPDLKL